MTDNYAKIVQDNFNQLYGNLPKDLAKNLPGEQEGERFVFNAFGEKCLIEPKGVTLGGKEMGFSLMMILKNLLKKHNNEFNL